MKTLFLDISSTCTGYVIAESTKNKAIIQEVGAIWFHKDDSVEKKCYEIARFVKRMFINSDEKLEKVVFESYVFNTSRVMGSLVCPHLQGAVMSVCEELGLKLNQITPQTWRKNCGIKAVKNAKGKRDYKQPTEAYFRAKMDIPEKIESNITGNLRTVPSDYFDALGVCEGYLRGEGVKEFEHETMD